ncbi:MAG: amidohydrolase [Cyclobacteriaceae bacterium]|nr:amidohydrolase [Cyclobacteriaceae bacterium]
MQLLEKVKQLSQSLATETIATRRHLHAHPELSYKEFKTVEYVSKALADMGLAPQPIAGTGLVVLIEGKNPSSKVIALRADMDALPIAELNTSEYKSRNEGVMHACGHDAHTASLLATAKILCAVRNEFEGTVKLLFQPGEEKNPGGASIMIKEGALKNPAPAAIIGQHVMPLLPVGKVGFREGMYMASSDEIYLRVIGKGGHAAAPELLIDPVVVAAHIIIALQQIISRNASPKQPTVLSFGQIKAEGATNIVPDEVSIAGTFRALNEKWREEGIAKIKKMATGLAESMGARCEVTISHGYPYLENNPELTRAIRLAAEEYLDKDNVIDIDLTLGSEDFAYYSHVVPASFYRLGTRNEAKGITSYIHTPTFDIDESALAIGPGLMAWMAIKQLSF